LAAALAGVSLSLAVLCGVERERVCVVDPKTKEGRRKNRKEEEREKRGGK
jgi:hypothetical protein